MNLCVREFSQLDTSLAVALDEVTPDVRAALFTSDFYTVVSALLNEIQPDDWLAAHLSIR